MVNTMPDLRSMLLSWRGPRERSIAGVVRKVNGKATPTYQCWRNMINRCFNPNAKRWDRYGGRGISVCDRWRSFNAFVADMGERPAGLTIERINNNGNYEPGNCRWATRREQLINRDCRVSPTMIAEAIRLKRSGSTWSMLARHFNLPWGTVRQRVIRSPEWKLIVQTAPRP